MPCGAGGASVLFWTVGPNATRVCAVFDVGAEEAAESADGRSAFTGTYAGLRKKITQTAPTKIATRQSNSQKFVFRVVVTGFFERDRRASLLGGGCGAFLVDVFFTFACLWPNSKRLEYRGAEMRCLRRHAPLRRRCHHGSLHRRGERLLSRRKQQPFEPIRGR